MSLDSIELPAQVLRKYYSLPDHYTVGRTFEDWNSAIAAAKHAHAQVRLSVAKSMGEFDQCREADGTPYLHSDRCADTSVRLDLRWVIKDANGTEHDVIVESFTNVTKLRPQSGPVV